MSKKTKKVSTALSTAIEKTLKIEDNRISAKVLYEFLELNVAVYSRWCKTQILENAFAEESVDFIPLQPLNTKVERTEDGRFTANQSTDYLLSIPFAKKLCMLSKSDKGEQARNYFIEREKAAYHAETALEHAILLNYDDDSADSAAADISSSSEFQLPPPVRYVSDPADRADSDEPSDPETSPERTTCERTVYTCPLQDLLGLKTLPNSVQVTAKEALKKLERIKVSLQLVKSTVDFETAKAPEATNYFQSEWLKNIYNDHLELERILKKIKA
ncbi:hypothetical protein AGMMS49975_14590 [Clostridia bacterium]|nr:hypothetical protein AGMMS49975_14590 [Clostridia bacterium]